jgi:citrate synthase
MPSRPLFTIDPNVAPGYHCVNIDSAINMTDHAWLTAVEASRALRVSRATLYAYVSRGFIRSQSTPGSTRERRYARDDVERLRRRTEERRDPDKAAAHALQWGMPILESAIALIDGSHLYYRGHDAVALSRSRSLAEVASLIWTGTFDTTFPSIAPKRAVRSTRSDGDLSFVPRAQSMLARESSNDPLAFDLRPDTVALTGWRILHVLTAAAARPHAAATIDQTLAREWRVTARGVDVLRAALILCADHELNVSAFTARCVASAGSHPYASVIAGLSALEGTKHGGASARVESMLESMRRARHLPTALGDRLRRGEAIDGFGHPLYPNGDPRATALMDMLRDRYAPSRELAFVLELAREAEAVLREKPNVDFALAAIARVLRLPRGSPLTLFAIGRTIGWIGHAIEQYATGHLIRPRAKYVGVAAIPANASE